MKQCGRILIGCVYPGHETEKKVQTISLPETSNHVLIWGGQYSWNKSLEIGLHDIFGIAPLYFIKSNSSSMKSCVKLAYSKDEGECREKGWSFLNGWSHSRGELTRIYVDSGADVSFHHFLFLHWNYIRKTSISFLFKCKQGIVVLQLINWTQHYFNGFTSKWSPRYLN